MDISLKKGDIVAVIKQQDPMGNKMRWFVDRGGNDYSVFYYYYYFQFKCSVKYFHHF